MAALDAVGKSESECDNVAMNNAAQFEPFGYCQMPAHWLPTALAVLQDARALLDNPARYISGHISVDADGNDLFSDHEDAVKHSLLGSLYAVCGCSAPGRKVRPGQGWAELALANFLVNRTGLDHWAYRFGSAQHDLTYDEAILTLDLAIADLTDGLFADPGIDLISRMHEVAGKARRRKDEGYAALLKRYAADMECAWKSRRRARPRPAAKATPAEQGVLI